MAKLIYESRQPPAKVFMCADRTFEVETENKGRIPASIEVPYGDISTLGAKLTDLASNGLLEYEFKNGRVVLREKLANPPVRSVIPSAPARKRADLSKLFAQAARDGAVVEVSSAPASFQNVDGVMRATQATVSLKREDSEVYSKRLEIESLERIKKLQVASEERMGNFQTESDLTVARLRNETSRDLAKMKNEADKSRQLMDLEIDELRTGTAQHLKEMEELSKRNRQLAAQEMERFKDTQHHEAEVFRRETETSIARASEEHRHRETEADLNSKDAICRLQRTYQKQNAEEEKKHQENLLQMEILARKQKDSAQQAFEKRIQAQKNQAEIDRATMQLNFASEEAQIEADGRKRIKEQEIRFANERKALIDEKAQIDEDTANKQAAHIAAMGELDRQHQTTLEELQRDHDLEQQRRDQAYTEHKKNSRPWYKKIFS